MTYLQEFYHYKNQLMHDMLTDETIVHLLDSDLPVSQGSELAYTQVFPYEYIPDTTEHGQTFICFDVDVQSVQSKTYLTPILYIWVFTHKSKDHLPEGGVRVDEIVSQIDYKINGSMYYGLGRLNLYSIKRFAPMTDYHGKVITYTMSEFNKTAPYSNKPVPAKRGVLNGNN